MTYVTITTKPCVVCKKHGIMQVWDRDYERFMNGALLQDAFPDLSAPIREQIHTGIHPECWVKLFGEDES